MIKKTFIFIALLWVGFLGYIVLKKPVDEVLEEPVPSEPVIQASEPVAQDPPLKKIAEKSAESGVIPFTPLPDQMTVPDKEDAKPVEKIGRAHV